MSTLPYKVQDLVKIQSGSFVYTFVDYKVLLDSTNEQMKRRIEDNDRSCVLNIHFKRLQRTYKYNNIIEKRSSRNQTLKQKSISENTIPFINNALCKIFFKRTYLPVKTILQRCKAHNINPRCSLNRIILIIMLKNSKKSIISNGLTVLLMVQRVMASQIIPDCNINPHSRVELNSIRICIILRTGL